MNVAAFILATALIPDGWRPYIADVASYIALAIAGGTLVVGIINNANKAPLKQILFVTTAPLRFTWYLARTISGATIGVPARWAVARFKNYNREVVGSVVEEHLEPVRQEVSFIKAQLLPNGGSSMADKMNKLVGLHEKEEEER